MGKKMGRPPKHPDEKYSEKLTFKVRKHELAIIEELMNKIGAGKEISLSKWIRDAVLEKAQKELERV